MGSCRQSFVVVLLSFSNFPLQHRTTGLEAQSFPRTIPGNQITLAAILSEQKVSPSQEPCRILSKNWNQHWSFGIPYHGRLRPFSIDPSSVASRLSGRRLWQCPEAQSRELNINTTTRGGRRVTKRNQSYNTARPRQASTGFSLQAPQRLRHVGKICSPTWPCATKQAKTWPLSWPGLHVPRHSCRLAVQDVQMGHVDVKPKTGCDGRGYSYLSQTHSSNGFMSFSSPTISGPV